MNVYSAPQAAAELGIDPRQLRRFLRSDESYRSAGMGGRYQFVGEAELASLKHAYAAFLRRQGKAASTGSASSAPADDDPRILDDDPGVSEELLTPAGLPQKIREERQAARAARQQRLLVRMSEVLAPRADVEEPA